MQARPDKPQRLEHADPRAADLTLSTQQDYDQSREVRVAIGPIEARGMKVVTRVELAAALLASP
jgi:hypothetical protein